MTAAGYRRNREGGAALVEFALVAPVFFALVMALIEFSIGIFSITTANSAAADAARRGAITRDDPMSDVEIIQAFRARAASAGSLDYLTIVIYNAESGDAEPPLACREGRQTDGCNAYTTSDFDDVATLCENGAGGWCPEEREQGQLLGVWFEVEYDGVTGLLPSPWRRTGHAVAEIEPSIATD